MEKNYYYYYYYNKGDIFWGVVEGKRDEVVLFGEWGQF
jgi:hypothetical protein